MYTGKPLYTKKDMKTLETMSVEGSPTREFLEIYDYDPKRFQKFLVENGLQKEAQYLFDLPLEEIPLLMDRGEISGYLRFRLTVGK